MIRFFFLFSLVLFLNLHLSAQLTVTGGSTIGMTPTEFVQTYLVGTGVAVSNATYNGSAEPLNSPDRIPLKARDEIGSFSNSGGAIEQLGISGGVLLSTGYVTKAVNGQNPSDDMWGNNQPAESDPDLVILAGNTIHDKSILEFDFVPQTDVITFNYVFGSIEFDGFCASINDAFGLFLSGPGIAGGLGFTNDAVNIALLPNSTSYVTIFNICEADQGNLGNGVYSWWNLKKDYFSYNRLTYVFSASYSVVCNQTYHMKFAIGDASDGVLDSGVFLEQNSFSSNNVTLNASCSNPFVSSLLIPGCSTTEIFYSILQPKTTDLSIELAIDPSGTATQSDILPNPFPTHVVIPAGQTESPIITIEAIPLALPQPDKSLIIAATVVTCGVPTTVTSTITISYNDVISATAPPATICSGGTASLTATAIGGQPFLPSNTYQYLWNTGAATSTISVNPGPGHHDYSVSVTDACGQTVTVTTWVDVGTTPEAAGPISGNAILCTPANGIVYSIPPVPGADEYTWSLPPGATIVAGNNTNAITVDFSTAAASGNITVFGHSIFCGNGAAAALPLTIHPAPESAGPIAGSITGCQGPAAVTYSIAPLAFTTTYEWQVPPGVNIISGANTSQISCIFTSSAVSGNFTVRGYNAECGYGASSTLAVTINPLPGNAGIITSAGGSEVCQREVGVPYHIDPIPFATNYQWTYTGTGATLVINGNDVLIEFSSTATSGILTVKGNNGCGDGLLSPPFPITVKLKPTVVFQSCNSLVTTKNGRPVLLKGGHPAGAGGIYSGTGVTMVSPGTYIFDPASSGVTGGGTSNGINYQIEYRYTNSQGCFDDQQITISVFASNASDPCPGTVKDYRDGKIYPTFMAGTGVNARCWTAANLNYGAYTNYKQVQTDNCTIEKYCQGNIEARCDLSGGYYQWGELMEYNENSTYQDICPPGWHVATPAEWDMLTASYQGSAIAGSALKDLLSPSGFHGMLEGMYYLNTSWSFAAGSTTGSMFWTAGSVSGSHAHARGLNNFNPSVSSYPSSRGNAFAVRCVRN